MTTCNDMMIESLMPTMIKLQSVTPQVCLFVPLNDVTNGHMLRKTVQWSYPYYRVLATSEGTWQLNISLVLNPDLRPA